MSIKNTTAVEREKEVTKEVHHLAKNLGALKEMIDGLEHVITPVMSNERPIDVKTQEAGQSISSGLALELQAHNDSVEEMLTRVRILVERVEL